MLTPVMLVMLVLGFALGRWSERERGGALLGFLCCVLLALISAERWPPSP